jgi:hypothetical protein
MRKKCVRENLLSCRILNNNRFHKLENDYLYKAPKTSGAVTVEQG